MATAEQVGERQAESVIRWNCTDCNADTLMPFDEGAPQYCQNCGEPFDAIESLHQKG